MGLQTFIDGAILPAAQLNQLQAGLLQSNSVTPLVLSGQGVQLTVAGSASINSLSVTLNTTTGSLSVTGVATVPTAANHDNSNLIANTAWVTTAISEITQTGVPYAPSSIAETGGTINGITIGLAVPAAAIFTSAQANTPTINDSSTHVATTAFVVGQAGIALPIIDGTATIGTSLLYARQDHVHASDTTKANLASPVFTGTPTAPTPTSGDVSLKLATTAFVNNAVASGGTFVAGSVAITGGTINNTSLGATTPSSAVFTTVGMNSLPTSSPTAGTNLLWNNGGVVCIASSSFGTGGSTSTTAFVRYGIIITTGSSYTALVTDNVILVNKGTGSATGITLPTGATTWQQITIKDMKGDAATHNITVTGTIDGGSSAVLNTNYASVDLLFNGTNWSIL